MRFHQKGIEIVYRHRALQRCNIDVDAKSGGVFGIALMRCRGQPLDTEDAAVAALRYKSGALGTISSGYYNQGGKFPSNCTD